MTKVPVLLITGSVGVGKTSVALEVSEQLEARGIPHAFVDADVVYVYPAPSREGAGPDLGERLLRGIWQELRRAGAERLVLTRVIDSAEKLDLVRHAVVGADVALVRLTAPLSVIHERIRARERGSGLQWHLEHAAGTEARWDHVPVEYLTVATEQRTVGEVAGEVLVQAGWLTAAG